jgi:hypothetical protein
VEDIERLKRRRLTPEEVRQGLEAMERVKRHSEEIHASRGGTPFPPSWKIINEMRDERTRQLIQAQGWPTDWAESDNVHPSEDS